jgi:hypothetical protein
MALRFIDSFDHYAATDLIQKWTWVPNGPAQTSIIPGRTNYALQLSQSAGATSYIYRTFDNQPTWCVGVAYRNSNIAQCSGVSIIQFWDTATSQMELRINSSGNLFLSRNNTTLATSSSNLSNNIWYYIEFLCTISPSISSNQCMVNVNNTNWLNLPAGTNTRATSNSYANMVSFLAAFQGSYFTGIATQIDDLYILDGTGSAPLNTFLGDSRVEAHFPSQNGSLTNWTPSSGNAFGCINDPLTNSDSNFISSSTVNNVSSFPTTPLSSSPTTIFGMQLSHSSRKSDAGTRQVQDFVRLSSTNYPGVTNNLSNSYSQYSTIYPNDPSTSLPWTLSNLNAVELGVKQII